MDNKAVFTTKEAARCLGVSQTTIYRMEKQGLLSSMRTPDGQRRFSRESIERYLKESQNYQAPQNPSLYRRATLRMREPEATYALGGIEDSKSCVRYYNSWRTTKGGG